MKTANTLLIIFLVSSLGFAQEMPQLSSYMYNQFVYNPASGGMYDADLNVNVTARIQWAGVQGAPISTYAWGNYRFSKNSMALGANVSTDKIGARSFTDVAATYTYIIRLTNQLKLSLGVRAGFTTARFNANEVSDRFDSDDNLIRTQTNTYPKFGTGFQLYNRNFYFGIGVPDIVSLNNSFGSDKNKAFFDKSRNYIGSAGYRFKLTDAFNIYPNAKIYYFPGRPTRVDVAALLEIIDYFWVGPNVASTGTAALMAGTFISSRIRFMYAYEFAYRQTAQSTTVFNVHEISLFLQLDELVSKRKTVQID